MCYWFQVCVIGEKTLTASQNKTLSQTLVQRRSTRLLEGILGTGGGRRSRIIVPVDGEESQSGGASFV